MIIVSKSRRKSFGKRLIETFLLTLLVLSLSVISAPVNGQSIGDIDLKTLNVDELTDEQVQNFVKQAKERGLSQQQLENLARQRGVSELQISKLKRRIEQLGNPESSMFDDSKSKEFGRSVNEETLPRVQKESVVLEGEDEIFGFGLFQRDELTFAPQLNLPTPVDYVLGPGDELIVDLWGATQQFMRMEVGTEGTIRPNNLGPIYVNGLTIKQAEEKVIGRLSQIYNGLKPSSKDEPNIFYQVSLGNIRTITVDVIGDVNKPGIFSLPSLATVYTALHSAGGPTRDGTLRGIQLVRNNKLISEVDIYSYLTAGLKLHDLRLESGDVIIVKPFQVRVKLSGELKRPGLYELKKGETFSDLLKYAGGFTNLAFRELVKVQRSGAREWEILNMEKDAFQSFVPKDGDIFEVEMILERFNNRVIIEGAVFREGEYELTDGLTLKELIGKADGLRGDAFMKRATIYRNNEDFSQTAIPFDLSALIKGEVEDIVLEKEDVVRISSIYDLREEYVVQIIGEVIEQGTYPFFDQMTVQDLILLSGGLKESGSGALIEISRRNKASSVISTAEIIRVSINQDLSLDSEGKNTVLKPFDQVYIRASPGYSVQEQVVLEGEVLAPGEYTLQRKDERISDLLTRAQGLSPYAFPAGAILIRKTEFFEKKPNDEVSYENLQKLKERVLASESNIRSLGRKRLIERLEKLERQTELDSEEGKIGSKFRRELTEDLAEQDSLVSEIEIQEEEPVAIDLKEILANPGSKYDLILRPGDIIYIPGKLETVRVAGEVTSPLNIRFDQSYGFKDYVQQSGGFLVSAKRGRSYVQYPNGERKGVKRFLWFKKYPKIQPGSTIFVSKKPDRGEFGVQGWISVSTSLATIGFLAIQVLR